MGEKVRKRRCWRENYLAADAELTGERDLAESYSGPTTRVGRANMEKRNEILKRLISKGGGLYRAALLL